MFVFLLIQEYTIYGKFRERLIIGASLSEPHIDDECVRDLFVCMYVCMVRRMTVTSLYVLYSTAHFISEAQCSPETARVRVRSESSLNQQNRGVDRERRHTRKTKRGNTMSQRQGHTSSADT